MSVRSDKVSEEIKHQINGVLSRDLEGLGLGLVTVTQVVVSNDIKSAKVYISFIGNKLVPAECINRINLKKKQIRMHLASRLYLKNIPELFFYYDDRTEYASKIDELIKQIHKDEQS
jgi:ribosome-binding factor A